MSEESQLRGRSARTQAASVRAVRQRAAPDHTSPARITEAQRRDSCLSLKSGKHSARRASPMALGGITFFSAPTRKRAWSTLTCVRAPREQTLPGILRVEAVHTLRAPLQVRRSRAGLPTLSSCGLRRHEGTHRHVPAMDRARLLVHGRHGTGAQDRSGPLPRRTLARRRQDGKTPRHPLGRFPAPGRGGVGRSTASTPRPPSSVPEAFRVARTPSGHPQRASVHTRRHHAATPGLAAGVTLRLIQDAVGHPTPPTTALSTPLTVTADARARQARTERRRHRRASRAGCQGRVGGHRPTPWTQVARPLRRPDARTPPGSQAGECPMPSRGAWRPCRPLRSVPGTRVPRAFRHASTRSHVPKRRGHQVARHAPGAAPARALCSRHLSPA